MYCEVAKGLLGRSPEWVRAAPVSDRQQRLSALRRFEPNPHLGMNGDHLMNDTLGIFAGETRLPWAYIQNWRSPARSGERK